jgi:hypothetical protein
MDDLGRRFGGHGQGRRLASIGESARDGRCLVQSDRGQRRVQLALEPAFGDQLRLAVADQDQGAVQPVWDR